MPRAERGRHSPLDLTTQTLTRGGSRVGLPGTRARAALPHRPRRARCHRRRLGPGPTARFSRSAAGSGPSPERWPLPRAPRGPRSISTRPASREPDHPARMRTYTGPRRMPEPWIGSPRASPRVAGDRPTFLSATGLVLCAWSEAEDPPARAVVLVQREVAHGSRPSGDWSLATSPSAASRSGANPRRAAARLRSTPRGASVDHQDRALGES